MKIIRNATEDEMLLSFLKSEIKSKRFSDDIRAVLSRLDLSEAIITNGSPESDKENELRKKVMAEFRGYPDKELFSEYPQNAKWVYVQFEKADLENIRYISYCYWDDLSLGTSKPLIAAENVKKGITVYDVPNDNFWEASKYLKEGNTFDPIILIANSDIFTALEGHVRLTAYAMNPDYFDGTYGYVAYPE